MSDWSAEKNVLKCFRMLSAGEALWRRLLLSVSTAFALSLLVFFRHEADAPANIMFKPFLFLHFFYMVTALAVNAGLVYLVITVILSPARFKNLLSAKTMSGTQYTEVLEEQLRHRVDEVQKASASQAVDDNEPQADESAQQDLPDLPTVDRPVWEDAPSTLTSVEKVLFSDKTELAAKLIISFVVGVFIFGGLGSMSVSQDFLASMTINTIGMFLVSNLLLIYIRDRELDDFASKLWEKWMLLYLYNFGEAVGFFLLGKTVTDGKRIGLPRRERFMHVLIGAPTGEGKSTQTIIPQILNDATSVGSAVIPDEKHPELLNYAAGAWMKAGKKVYAFCPWDDQTIAINPLLSKDIFGHTRLTEDTDLITIVEMIMQMREEAMKAGDPFFKSRTRYIIFALLKLVQSFRDEYCTLPAIYHICANIEILQQFIDNAPPIIRRLWVDFDKLGNETRVNALTAVRERLDVFMEASVRKAFSKPEFDLSMLFREKEPCLLIVGAPFAKGEVASKIASLIINLIVNKAIGERASYIEAKQKKKKKIFVPNDIYLYLDELKALAVTRLAHLVAIARSAKIQVIGSVTDLGAFKVYKEDYSSLMANFRTQIYMRGLELESAKYISESLGDVNEPDYKLIRGMAIGQKTKRLLAPDEVRDLPEHEAIVFSRQASHFVVKLMSIFTSSWLKKKIVPTPDDMRKLYKSWGVAEGELVDSILPRIDEETFDMSKIKGNRSERDLDSTVENEFTREKVLKKNEYFKEEGGGTVGGQIPETLQFKNKRKGQAHDASDSGLSF